MSEEPDATASQTGAPASAQPSRLARALPSWVRRRPVIAACGAGIVVVAAVILVAVWPSAQPHMYAGLPARCEVLTASTLAKYLPEATSSLQSPSVTTVSSVDDCLWTSITGGRAGA